MFLRNTSAYGKCLIDQIDKNIRRCYENLWYQVFIPVLIKNGLHYIIMAVIFT